MCQDVSRFTATSATNVDEITHDLEDLDLYSHPSMIEGERPGAMPLLCDMTPSETRRTPSSCRVDLDKSRRHCVVGANTNDTTHCHYTTPVSESGEYNAIWCQNEDGDTPLHVALICYDLHAVASIVSMSTPSLLDVQNNLRQTPLHLSVIVDRPELVTLMLERGACATLQDRNGDTPLHIACRRGLLDCIEAMTSTVTLPDTIGDVMNYDGETIVHVAAAEGHVNIVRYLIQRPLSANVNVRDGRSGRTVLHHAVESRNMPVLMLLLLTPGVWVDAITYDGRTPLALAEGRSYGDIAELLVVAGADTACGWADSDLDDTNDDPYASADDNSADDTFFDDFCIRGRPVQSTRTTPVARTRD